MCSAYLCRFYYFFICSIGTGIADVFEYGTGEQIRFLRYNCNVSTEIVECDIFYIDIVDIYTAFLYIIKANKQICKRALSRARMTDYTYSLTRVYLKTDTVDYLAILLI
jgi:hypothetical protein